MVQQLFFQGDIQYEMVPRVSDEYFTDDFVLWCRDNLPHVFLIRDLPSDYVRGRWVQYQYEGGHKGMDQPIDFLALKNHAKRWLRENSQSNSDHNAKECLYRLEEHRYCEAEIYDPRNIQDPIINCHSGLYYPKRMRLEEHSAEYRSMQQVNATLMLSREEIERLKEDDGLRMSVLIAIEHFHMPRWMQMRKDYPVQMDIIERYMQAIIYNDIWIKLMLFIVGRSNTGKSTVGQIIWQIYRDLGVSQGIDNIAGKQNKWALSGCIGKKVLYDSDSATDRLNLGCVKVLKRIVGDPDRREKTAIIYKGEKEILYDFFPIILSNQLPKLPPGESQGFLKRSMVVVMNTIFNDDPDFEQDILKESDWIFTYLCLRPYNRLEPRRDFLNHVTTNQDLWSEWGEPLMMCFRHHFERSLNVDDIHPKEEVYNVVMDQMEAWKYEPRRRSDALLTELLKKIRIPNRERKPPGATRKEPFYVGLKYLRPAEHPNRYQPQGVKPMEPKQTLDTMIGPPEETEPEPEPPAFEQEIVFGEAENEITISEAELEAAPMPEPEPEPLPIPEPKVLDPTIPQEPIIAYCNREGTPPLARFMRTVRAQILQFVGSYTKGVFFEDIHETFAREEWCTEASLQFLLGIMVTEKRLSFMGIVYKVVMV